MKKFKPDAELLKFANYFSNNYKKLLAGEYKSSSKGKYTIKYLNRIKDERGMIKATFARISNNTGIIELDRIEYRKNKKLTDNFVFYIIMWCIVVRKNQNRKDWQSSLTDVDRITIEYYCTTGRPQKDVAIGWLSQFEKSSVDNKKRYEAIYGQLLKAQSKAVKNKKRKK